MMRAWCRTSAFSFEPHHFPSRRPRLIGPLFPPTLKARASLFDFFNGTERHFVGNPQRENQGDGDHPILDVDAEDIGVRHQHTDSPVHSRPLAASA